MVTGILNRRLKVAIQFRNTLHGFHTGRGTVNTYLKSKLIQYLMPMSKEFLYEILLDIHRSYDTLDRRRCLDILRLYVVGPWDLRLLQRY